MNRAIIGAALAVALIGSAATVSVAVAAPAGVVTHNPLPPSSVPPPAGVVPAQPKWALSCHTTAGEIPQITFKNIGSQSIGPTIGLSVHFATAPSYGLNLPRALAPGESLNLSLPDSYSGKPKGACTVQIFGVK